MILLWDSDISEVDERPLSPSSVLELHANYIANMSYVIKRIQKTKTGVLIALAGPILLGT